jgi:outer membrane protein TolC
MKRSMVLCLVFISSALAQSWSVEQAVQKALESNPDLKIVRLGIERAASETKGSGAELLPQLNLNASYYPHKTFVMPQNGAFSTREGDALHTDLSAKYLLWDGGGSRAKHQAAKINEKTFGHRKEESAQEVAEQVKQLYYTIDFLQNRIRSAQASVRFYDEQLKRAHALYRAGLKTEADESRFAASRYGAEEALRTLESERRKNVYRLSQLMGIEENAEILEGSLETRFQSIPVRVEFETLQVQLSTSNPKLGALARGIESAKLGIDAAEGERYGTIEAVAQYAWDESLSGYDSSFVGVVGSIPLYDGGKRTSQLQKAKIDHALTQQEYERSRDLLEQALFDAVQDVNRSDHLLQTQQAIERSAQKTLTLMQGRYAQGLVGYVDILEAQSLYEHSQNGIDEAKLLKVLAWGRIEKLLNRGTAHHD